jgi:hypothetical protein
VPRLFAIALVLSLGIACNNPPQRATRASASSTASPLTACERAWRDFAAIDDFHDRVRAAVPTLHACQSLKEWIRVGRATPGHRLRPAKITAVKMCRHEEGVRSAPVCRSL